MKYYAELLKIIEGGLRGDKQKISDYSIWLAKKLKTAGEEKIRKDRKNISKNR